MTSIQKQTLETLKAKKEEWQVYVPINKAAHMMKESKIKEYEEAIQLKMKTEESY
ncbi:hypothetical protein [Staphylococcus hyicus]|uniref:Uncharacterized protein n=1 Tax=Staphylococcus hyicus TaxID=1284 RepID=A0ACD5FPY9_STAHY|nr:hypothetical protein [Staphylococcus hyicus]AJC95078.1 hypothetical protein SHYC_01335 [Staphylococcus hyicus]MCE5154378.1 hypothetical protein [Staphylococcus hyicus]MDP4449318.1 hypothetical protein [Staphylococcus hyicus]MDP4463354.1 hypothetical protein [Staphylococcus hyicus]MDP4469400.1 hypothetical protein [Staphylococcus hyicus]